jgi:hypothetical protein
MGLNLGGLELLKKVATGGGIGAGAIAIYELLEIAKHEPRLLESVISWGPVFALAIVGMLLVDRRVGDGVQALKDNALAQQRMSDAVSKIADKDDRQAEKLETLTSYSALQSEKVLNHLETQGERLNDHGQVLRAISEVLNSKLGAVIPVPAEGDKAKSAIA